MTPLHTKDNKLFLFQIHITMKFLKYIISGLLFLAVVSCVDNEFSDKNYYEASKRTAAQYISDSPERFSMFEQILKRANYFNMLATYGKYTVFVPTNSAVETFLKENKYACVDSIPLEKCDTIARSHIINDGAFFTVEYSNGTLPAMNMDDRYLVMTCDSDVNNDNAFMLFVNKRSKLIEKDDSVTNGVVHTIDRIIVPSNEFLPDLIANDPKTKIFAEALQLTNLCDSLTKYIDDTYSVGNDSVEYGIKVHYGGGDWDAKYHEKRYFKYTALVETDSVFHANKIFNIGDLIDRAKEVYNQTFPQYAGLYDTDYKDPRNPLYRFVAYHLLDCQLTYDQLAPSGEVMKQCLLTNVADPEAFWQTMCPDAMIRFSRADGVLYANRKGVGKKVANGQEGIKILDPSESGTSIQEATNGQYHYLDGVLFYDTNVRDKILNCRMRIDATYLSPDFWNAKDGIRVDKDALHSFKNGFIKNWKTTKETYVGVRSQFLFMSSFLANAICVKGAYDVQIKLPTPPPGLYEIRLGYVAGEDRDVIQVYLNNEPCGIPIDLRIGAWGPEVGYEADIADDPDHNVANDKAMRNRGYLKAMDSYRKPGATNFRTDAPEHLRRILATHQFREGEEVWLRIRQVTKQVEWSFDYIELCPKSVYASPEGEDTH